MFRQFRPAEFSYYSLFSYPHQFLRLKSSIDYAENSSYSMKHTLDVEIVDDLISKDVEEEMKAWNIVLDRAGTPLRCLARTWCQRSYSLDTVFGVYRDLCVRIRSVGGHRRKTYLAYLKRLQSVMQSYIKTHDLKGRFAEKIKRGFILRNNLSDSPGPPPGY